VIFTFITGTNLLFTSAKYVNMVITLSQPVNVGDDIRLVTGNNGQIIDVT